MQKIFVFFVNSEFVREHCIFYISFIIKKLRKGLLCFFFFLLAIIIYFKEPNIQGNSKTFIAGKTKHCNIF